MSCNSCDDTLTKHPSQSRTYYMDFGQQPEIAEDGQTLASIDTVTGTLVAGGGASSLTITVPALVSGTAKAKALFAGGTDGQTYAITWTATASGGSQLVCCGTLKIDDCLP